MVALVLVRIFVLMHVLIRVSVFIQAAVLVMTNILIFCIDVDINFRIDISIYNGTGRFLRISDFCIPNSELRLPMSDFRISERLDFTHVRPVVSRLQDFQVSRFADF